MSVNANTPSLDELARSAMAAWLWDGARRRIVWANQAGLAFFAAESLFDLVERRFGSADPGAARIAELAGELANDIGQGQTSPEELRFSSAPNTSPVQCHCYGFDLADGRNGVLVVAAAIDNRPNTSNDAYASAIDALPQCVLVVSPAGDTRLRNLAAQEMFEDTALDNLQMLLGNDAAASKAISSALSAGVFSRVAQLTTRFGPRDFRLHVQRIDDTRGDVPGKGRLLVMMEDVTDRRALERQLEAENKTLSDFADAATDFSWKLDRQMVFTDVSERFESVTGTPANAVLGESWKTVSERFNLDQDGKVETLLALGEPWCAVVEWNSGETDQPPVELTLSAVPLNASAGGFRGVATRSWHTHVEETASDHWRDAEAEALAAYAGEEEGQGEEVTNSAGEAESVSGVGRLSAEDEAAFRALGETLANEIPINPISSGEAIADTAVEEPQLEEEAFVEEEMSASTRDVAIDAVIAIIDGLPSALVIHREGELLHVNPFAAALLGYEDVEDAMRAGTLARVFGVYADDLLGAEAMLTYTSVPYACDPVRLNARTSTIAWPDGEAVQIGLEVASEERTEVQNDQVMQVAPLPATTPPSALGDDDLRAMLNTATDGVVTLDQDGTVLALNSSAEAIFGYDSDDAIGTPLSAMLTKEGTATLDAYIADLADSGIASAFNDGREVIAVEKNGGEIPLFLSLGRLSAQGEGDEKKLRFCAVLRDMTSWKKTEADLRQAKDKAERASAQKSDFLANISHELRTPLNAILGFSEVMKSRKLGAIGNEKYASYVNDIHSSGKYLLALINDLLDLSKIESGKLDLNFTSVELDEIVAQCINLLKDQARDAKVVVRTALQPDLPGVVADQRSMSQIILNLLSNAIKFTGRGGQIAISGKLEANGEVCLKVKDTGRGMSGIELQKALEPFTQVGDGPRGGSGSGGTGLGLPLTKALTEANRAQFKISSEPDKGTLVTITFPTARVMSE